MIGQLYKVLRPGRECIYGGRGPWPESGVPFKVEGKLVECSNGLHVLTVEQLPMWVTCPCEVWEVSVPEGCEFVAATPNVFVVREATLTRCVGSIEQEDWLAIRSFEPGPGKLSLEPYEDMVEMLGQVGERILAYLSGKKGENGVA